jgi:BirA family biotin operon repressor/biotin-[acetyl-CoA-carboxylase] ligase
MIIGSKLIFIENLTSTNTHAMMLLQDNHPQEGTVIYTDYQSEGKGQMGNKWESEAGKNLLFSIILYPTTLLPGEQFLITMIISLGIFDFLKKVLTDCTIKWPNDICVKDSKIAGILIENTIKGNAITGSVAGIGLNVNQVKFISDAPNPVSMSMVTGKVYDLNDCLRQLVKDLDKRYKQLLSGKYSTITKNYISVLYRYNEWCNFRDSDGIFTGRIISVTDSGNLKVEKRSGKTCEYLFKEVEFMQ